MKFKKNDEIKGVFFKNGLLTINPKENPALADIFFSPKNYVDSAIYIMVENSLPEIKGLKRPDKRADFTIKLVDAMKKNGITLSLDK